MTASINIAGPAGQLEALWHQTSAGVDNSTAAVKRAGGNCCALLCHPHPQYGGSMHDGVLAIAADVLSAQGIAHLRFNFRGVGASDGEFDHGQGESDDLCAAWQWLTDQAGPTESKWNSMLLIGYSFGAATAWAARARCPNLQQLLLIAPPTQAMPFPGEADGVSTQVIVGDADSYCDHNTLPSGATAQVISGADHFFSGSAGELSEAISAALGNLDAN